MCFDNRIHTNDLPSFVRRTVAGVERTLRFGGQETQRRDILLREGYPMDRCGAQKPRAQPQEPPEDSNLHGLHP